MFEVSTWVRARHAWESFAEAYKVLANTEVVRNLGPLLRLRARVAERQEGLARRQAEERGRGLLDVTVLDDVHSFEALEEEWEDLYRNSPSATPFQSWSWLYSWWESFGDEYELRLITVRDGGLLVGLMPLMLERRWGFRRLLFIGKFDQLDLLARRGWEYKVSEVGIRALGQMMGSWHVVDLKAVSPYAAAWDVYRQWNGPKTHIPIAHYLYIEVKPWDELIASLSRNHRQTVRRTLRRAEEDGVRSALVGPEEAEQAARRLVALHRELRQGRPIFRRHLTSRFESFIVAAARRMTGRRLGAISEFRRDGEVLISQFAVFGDEVTDAYLIGVSRDMARSRNGAYVYLSNGREPYKQRWASEDVRYCRIMLFRNPVLWGLYLTCFSVLEAARGYMAMVGL
jgi:CelD/BcsL family acetyltransferase involved in cellulose biosynthesis